MVEVKPFSVLANDIITDLVAQTDFSSTLAAIPMDSVATSSIHPHPSSPRSSPCHFCFQNCGSFLVTSPPPTSPTTQMPEWCLNTNLESPNSSCSRQSSSKPNPAFLPRLTLVSLSEAAWNWCSRHTVSSVISQNHGFLSPIQYRLYFLIRMSNVHSSFKLHLKCHSSWEAFPSAPGGDQGLWTNRL